MKNLIKTTILGIAAVAAACSGPIDPFEEFTDGEEIRYAGKANDLSYTTGKNRLAINFVLGPDPNVSEAKIFWNMQQESVTVPVDRTALTDDVVSQVIENLPENTYNFEVRTYDKFGNSSVPAYVTAKTYGPMYEATLATRGVAEIKGTNAKKDIVLTLGDTIPANYSTGTEITYFRTSGEKVVEIVPNSELNDKGVPEQVNAYTMTDFDYSRPAQFRSLFTPEANSLDVFASKTVELTIDKNTIPINTIQVPKPYASYHIEGFDQEKRDASALWDGSCTCVWDSYNGYKVDDTTVASGINWKGYSGGWRSVIVDGATYYSSPLWVTFDLGEAMQLSKVHIYFYYHFKDQFPKVNEWWAYTGEGAPQAPAEGETGWENWVKIAEKSYDTDNMTLDEKKAVYEAGQVQELDGSVKAQYYRFVCRKGIQYKDEQPADKQDHWRNTAFSLSEVTFWRYE